MNIFASSPSAASALIGNHENTEVGDFLRDYLDLDLTAVTKELKEKGAMFDTKDASGQTVSWMGRMPDDGERLDGQDHLEHYHGDHKKHRRSCNVCGV